MGNDILDSHDNFEAHFLLSFFLFQCDKNTGIQHHAVLCLMQIDNLNMGKYASALTFDILMSSYCMSRFLSIGSALAPCGSGMVSILLAPMIKPIAVTLCSNSS